MKPGSRDRKYGVMISGEELEELQKLTWMMAESFGLDSRIDNYKGKKPIGLYRWDLECLTDVISLALNDARKYPDKSVPGYKALKNLYERLEPIEEEAFND